MMPPILVVEQECVRLVHFELLDPDSEITIVYCNGTLTIDPLVYKSKQQVYRTQLHNYRILDPWARAIIKRECRGHKNNLFTLVRSSYYTLNGKVELPDYYVP